MSGPLPRYLAFFALLLATLALAVIARADVLGGGNVRVSFRASINPKALPRSTSAPIALHVAAKVVPVEGRRPEALRRVTVELNRHATTTTRGLPRCPWRKLLSVNSHRAMKVCGDALIGTGHFSSHIDIPEQAPFPAEGRMLAFNSSRNGRPAVAAHVFGRDPAAISEVLPMTFSRRGQGSFGPIVTVQMPNVGNEWGYVTGFDLTLKRTYRYRGHRMSVISASCPAPADLDEVPFKAARGVFELADGNSLTRSVGGSCRVAATRTGSHR
jgi:hypothetical protein